VTGPLTEADLDRLADFAAGALDPIDSRRVAGLVESRPEWASAYRTLAAADHAVREELQRYGRSRLAAMPGDVAARIDAALADLIGTAPRGTRVDGSTARVVQLRRGGRRWAALAAAAATLVAVLGGAFAVRQGLSPRNGGGTEANAPAAGRGLQDNQAHGPMSPPTGMAGADAGGQGAESAPLLFASGTNYHLNTLYLLTTSAFSPASSQTVGKASVPMATTPQLAACLTAITRGQPGVITKVDQARFDGIPALVVLIVITPATGATPTPGTIAASGTAPSGSVSATGAPTGSVQLVIAVGTDCGPAGVHELGRQRVS
jgi:hypothetical protein